MLSHDDTMLLIKKAQQGDIESAGILINQNMPLIKSIVKHYKGRQNVEYDDLIQIGSMGLVKAIRNFDTGFNVRFSTYAVPMITGEIKRYIRDDGIVKVSRSIKTLSVKISIFVDTYKNREQKEPTIAEIAKEFDISEQDVVFTMDSSKFPVSIYEKNEDSSQSLIDKIPDDSSEEVLDKILLKEAISNLSEREKKLIIFRYFRDKTQSEVAELLGVSQVQVSRLESKILEKMRKDIS